MRRPAESAGPQACLRRPEGTYRVALPDWGGWLRILDRAAAGGDGAADVDRLLQAWLRAAVTLRPEGAAAFAPVAAADLPSGVADALLAEGARLFDAQRAGLAPEVTRTGDGAMVRAGGRTLRVRALSLAERNACLRPHLGLVDGAPVVDAAAYEVALVARSTTEGDGDARLDAAQVAALPVPLGEALAQAARALSDPDAGAEMAAFLGAGVPHPDLELASLCLAYGLTPAEADALPAATARRLEAAARLIGAAGSAAAPAPAEPDTLTRIVVRDG